MDVTIVRSNFFEAIEMILKESFSFARTFQLKRYNNRVLVIECLKTCVKRCEDKCEKNKLL
jgi:hypothetical protein